MITEVVTRAGRRIHVLSERDLDVDAAGERLRAFCPIHGSDHQRSLSIDAANGWGWCHQCHATVFVEEYDAESRRAPSSHFPRPRPSAARPQWQRDEVAALQASWPLMREELASERAQAYLDERALPPEIAAAGDIGYLSRAGWHEAPVPPEQHEVLSRWIGRVVFPLGSPDGRGYIGRTLVRWEPGMDENQHKAVLEAADIKRWIKTNPAGWYGPHPSRYAPTLILVEGGFDRLACVAAGIPPQALVALVSTAAKAEWIIRYAPQVRRIVLALDGDDGGREAMERLADEFQAASLTVSLCPPPQDGEGKDWSERYRLGGESGVWPLIETIMHEQ